MNINKKSTSTGTVTNIDLKVNRIFVIDCSGSMYGELPRIRQQMKNKIPQLTNIGDTVSIIWFSSRNQFGTLQEGLEINSVTDFKGMNAAIDKYLRDVGCTGFKDPLDEVYRVSTLLKKRYAGSVSHMFFMTDGCDNEWSQAEIMKSAEKLGDTLDAATYVEYGWYSNRSLITKMADVIGANVMFAKSFDEYDGVFTKNVNKKIASTKKKEIDLGNSTLDYAFTKKGDEIISFAVTNGKILVPEDVQEIYYFVPAGDAATTDEDGKYTAVYTLAQRMEGHSVLDILGDLGDVALIDQFNNCFSKQDYSDFQSEVLTAITDPSKRYTKGKKANYVPAPDCPTIIDLLDELASNPENKLHPYDPNFKYERISAARADANSTLNDEEQALLDSLLEQLKSTKSVDEIKKINEAIAALSDSKVSIKFKPTLIDGGYSISSLTFNEDRPNISVLVRVDGTVELPPNEFGVPTTFPTFIFRNYAVVADGIKHSSMSNLPMELSASSFEVLKTMGVIDPFDSHVPGKVYYLNANLPVVNRKMATSVSAKDFFTKVVQLQALKSTQKVFNTFRKASFEKVSEGFKVMYGEDATAWLKTLGLTDGGFSPKMVSVEARDQYTAKEFGVSIEKCSSIPPINDKLLEKVAKGTKLTLSESLCVPAIKSYNTLIESEVYKASSAQTAILKTWLESESKNTTTSVRTLIREIAKIKFAIMVGHVWFNEFASLDENTMTIDFDGQAFNCKAELKDIVVKL